MSALSSSAAENCGSATPKCWQSKLKRNVKMSSTVSFYCKVRHIATMKNIHVQQLTLILIYIWVILYLLWTLRGDLRFDSTLKIRLCQVNHIRLCDLTIRQSYFCLVRRTQNSFALAMGSVSIFFLGLPHSFLAPRGFATRRSRAHAHPSLNLQKERDRSQSSQNCLNCQNDSLPTEVTFPTVY